MKDFIIFNFVFFILPLIGTAAIEKCVDAYQNSLPPTPEKQDASFHRE